MLLEERKKRKKQDGLQGPLQDHSRDLEMSSHATEFLISGKTGRPLYRASKYDNVCQSNALK